MSDLRKSSNEEKWNGMSAVAAATGVIIGAGLGVAGAATLRNKQNRAKLGKALSGVMKRGSDLVSDVSATALEKKDAADKVMEKTKDRAKKLVK